MINRDYLNEQCRNKTRLAKDLNISRMCLWKKIKGLVEFNESEIEKLIKIYGKAVLEVEQGDK